MRLHAHTLFSRSSFSSVSCRLDSSLRRERCSVLLLFSSTSSACCVSCSLSSRLFLSLESWRQNRIPLRERKREGDRERKRGRGRRKEGERERERGRKRGRKRGRGRRKKGERERERGRKREGDLRDVVFIEENLFLEALDFVFGICALSGQFLIVESYLLKSGEVKMEKDMCCEIEDQLVEVQLEVWQELFTL